MLKSSPAMIWYAGAALVIPYQDEPCFRPVINEETRSATTLVTDRVFQTAFRGLLLSFVPYSSAAGRRGF
jgi:hypothetical protein